MNRNDLLIRASRHYEGAMLAFIRQATSSFNSKASRVKVSSSSQYPVGIIQLLYIFKHIMLKTVEKNKAFEWVEVNCPARLDLAGGWYI